jgi:biotin carboxyl carrier protein
MRLRIALDGREHEVLVEGEAPDLRVSLAGRSHDVRVDVHGDRAEATVDGRTIPLMFGGGVRIDGMARTARVEWLPEEAAIEGGAKVVEVRPPMPGRIVRVVVKPGDAVRPGAPLVVLEAMKMQNEIPAPIGGIVLEVRVKEGDAVAANDVLVRLGTERPGKPS